MSLIGTDLRLETKKKKAKSVWRPRKQNQEQQTYFELQEQVQLLGLTLINEIKSLICRPFGSFSRRRRLSRASICRKVCAATLLYATTCVSSHKCVCVLMLHLQKSVRCNATICYYMLLYATTCVSSYKCVCVLMLMYVCPHASSAEKCALQRYYTLLYATICYYMRALIQMCVCPHANVCVSSC
jgi:hypothetical protein